MNAGSLRKDCLSDFLLRWVERLGAGAFVFDGGGADGRMMSSPGGPPPPPPPPAAKAGITAGVAMSVPKNTVSVTNLIAVPVMRPSLRFIKSVPPAVGVNPSSPATFPFCDPIRQEQECDRQSTAPSPIALFQCLFFLKSL
jgi:hypothetical protein